MNTKSITTTAAVLTVLTLTGCASGPSAEEIAATASAQAVQTACTDFETLNNDLMDRWVSGTGTDQERKDAAANFKSNIDEIALSASGDVKDRLEALIEATPAKPYELFSPDFWGTTHTTQRTEYWDAAKRVKNACEAAGLSISLNFVQFN